MTNRESARNLKPPAFLDKPMSFGKSQEAGACRLSGTVEFSFAGRSRYDDCLIDVCKAVKAAIAQQLPNSEEVELYYVEPYGLKPKRFWCNYVITFNSTTAMESSGIQDFLRSQPSDFSQHLSGHINFSTFSPLWECQKLLPMEVSRLTEPVNSFVAGTTSV